MPENKMNNRKNWYNIQEASNYVDLTSKIFLKLCGLGYFPKYILFNLVRFRKWDLDYYLTYLRESDDKTVYEQREGLL